MMQIQCEHQYCNKNIKWVWENVKINSFFNAFGQFVIASDAIVAQAVFFNLFLKFTGD